MTGHGQATVFQTCADATGNERRPMAFRRYDGTNSSSADDDIVIPTWSCTPVQSLGCNHGSVSWTMINCRQSFFSTLLHQQQLAVQTVMSAVCHGNDALRLQTTASKYTACTTGPVCYYNTVDNKTTPAPMGAPCIDDLHSSAYDQKWFKFPQIISCFFHFLTFRNNWSCIFWSSIFSTPI